VGFPNHPEKQAEAALVRPEEYLAFLRRVGKHPTIPVPEVVILCFQTSLLEHVRRHHACASGDGYLKDLLIPEEAGGRVGFFGGFGVGAPIAVIRLEELIAFGVRRVVSVGTAGSLQPDLGVGDLVVCERAIRDEGTSHHYVPTAAHAHASESLTRHLCATLDAAGCAYRVGTTWTIDAPYRETVAEVRRYQAEGVATVEMEAAALFAVAAYRGIELAAMFSISDTLADLQWEPRFGSRPTNDGLETLYRVARDVLAT